jgi:hypothetical protein
VYEASALLLGYIPSVQLLPLLFFFFFEILGFELRALGLLGR